MPVGRIQWFCSWLVACAAALWWSVDLTFLQPASEPRDPSQLPAETCTYWARDIRFSLIALAAVAFVWARGDRRSALWALFGALGWITVDLALDRADVSGTLWCISLAGPGCALLAGLWWLGSLRAARPSPRVLPLAAGMAAGVTAIANTIECGHAAAGEGISRLVCGGVGLAAALGCSVAARRGRVAPAMPTVIWLLAAALIVVGYLVPLDPDSSEALLRAALLLAVLFIAPAAQAGLADTAKEYLLIVVVSLLGVGVAVFAVMVAMRLSFVADLLTALAGSPAVNSSDTNVQPTIAGCVLGAAYGLALMVWRSGSEKRGDTSDSKASLTQ